MPAFSGESWFMSVKIFLSTVSDEFLTYRDALRTGLTRHNVEVKVQEDFKDLGGDTLDELDVYIAHCDAVVHLVGYMTGSDPGEIALLALRKKYPDLTGKLPPLGEALRNGLSRGAEGMDARARGAAMGHDPEQSRPRVDEARRARERHGAARRGGRRLSRGAEGM